jgi:hypothetical protein
MTTSSCHPNRRCESGSMRRHRERQVPVAFAGIGVWPSAPVGWLAATDTLGLVAARQLNEKPWDRSSTEPTEHGDPLDAGRKFLAVLSWRTALARNCPARHKKFSIEWRAASRRRESAVVNALPPNVAIGLGQPGQSTVFDGPIRPPFNQQSIVHPELTTALATSEAFWKFFRSASRHAAGRRAACRCTQFLPDSPPQGGPGRHDNQGPANVAIATGTVGFRSTRWPCRAWSRNHSASHEQGRGNRHEESTWTIS